MRLSRPLHTYTDEQLWQAFYEGHRGCVLVLPTKQRMAAYKAAEAALKELERRDREGPFGCSCEHCTDRLGVPGDLVDDYDDPYP